MTKRHPGIAVISCLLLYLIAIGSAVIRINRESASNEKTAEREFNQLVDRASSSAVFGFMSDSFREAVRDAVLSSKTLSAVIISGPVGPEYAFERYPGSIQAEADGPRFTLHYNTLPQPLFAPLRCDGIRNATVSASATRIDTPVLFIILRDAVLIALLSVFLGILFMILSPSKAQSPREAPNDTPPESEAHPPATEDEEYAIPDLAPEVTAMEDPECPHGLYVPDTQIGWEDYTVDRLASELHRCASFEQDLILMIIEAKSPTERWGELFSEFAEQAVNFFSFRDLVFERKQRGLTIILPNIDLEHGIRMAEEFMNKLKKRTDGLGEQARSVELRVGLSSRAGRLVDTDRLIMEASRALAKALEDSSSPVIAFKSDPERYRAFIANKI